MPIELVEALILIAKFCVSYENCAICPLKNFCGKMPSDNPNRPLLGSNFREAGPSRFSKIDFPISGLLLFPRNSAHFSTLKYRFSGS